MRKLFICLFYIALVKSYSQELNLPVFTQYLADNNFVVSPTYAGIGDNLRIRANALTQWVGIKNAPDNQSFFADFRIADRSGVGLSYFNDKNGNTSQSGFKASFAHHLILDYYSKQYLSLGISFNVNNFKLDVENFNTTFENPTLDPFVTDNRSTSNVNFDIGALYRNKGFFLSLNANNILKKNFDERIRISEPGLLLNYQIFSGLTIKSGKRIEYEPSIFYQLFSSDNRSSTDINFKFRKYNRKEDYYWLGVSYRFLNDQFLEPLNIGPMAGFRKSSFYMGYSYFVTANELAAFNSGSHVITIGFDFLQGISNCPCTQSPVH